MRQVSMNDRLRICKALAKQTGIGYKRVFVAVIGRPGGLKAPVTWTPVDNDGCCTATLKKTIFNVPRQFTAQTTPDGWFIVDKPQVRKRYPLDANELIAWAATAKNVDAIQEAHADEIARDKPRKAVLTALKLALDRWNVKAD